MLHQQDMVVRAVPILLPDGQHSKEIALVVDSPLVFQSPLAHIPHANQPYDNNSRNPYIPAFSIAR